MFRSTEFDTHFKRKALFRYLLRTERNTQISFPRYLCYNGTILFPFWNATTTFPVHAYIWQTIYFFRSKYTFWVCDILEIHILYITLIKWYIWVGFNVRTFIAWIINISDARIREIWKKLIKLWSASGKCNEFFAKKCVENIF